MAKRTLSRTDEIKPYPEKARMRIQASGLINRMIDHAGGQLKADGSELMTPSQVQAAKVLIGKVLPDLKALEHTGSIGTLVKIKNLSGKE